MRIAVVAILALIVLTGTARASVTLDPDATAKGKLQGGVVSYREEGADRWTELPQHLGEASTTVVLPFEPARRYQVRVTRNALWTRYSWEGTTGFVTPDLSVPIKDAALKEQWNLIAVILPAGTVAAVVLGIVLPRLRRVRHEARAAEDRAAASRAQAREATSQAFALAKIPLPTDYRVPGYRIVDLIGEGGMASVYRVESDAGDMLAMKVPHADCLKDNEYLERFRREIEIGRSIRHPAVLRIHDVGSYATERFPEVPFLVMEIVKGHPLNEVIAERAPLPVAQAAAWIRTAADALAAAHERRVIHRDIKPHNLMLTDRGEIKLMDFGIARASNSATLTATGTAMGTPAYMAPEQVGDSRRVDERADIYSLGIMLYEMLAGKVPFDDADPYKVIMQHLTEEPPPLRPINPLVPEALEGLVLRMLAKTADERPASAREVVEALSPFCGAC